MSTTASKLRLEIIAAINGSADLVTLVGGSMTVPPHVFDGEATMIGGRNRGRLPFLEVFVKSQAFTRESPEGGTMSSTVTIRAHCAGRDQATALSLLSGLLAASLKALRNAADSISGAPGYFTDGNESIGEPTKSPFAWFQDVALTVNHSYDRSTYELG